MEYLIRFCQWHETFRIAEIQALAVVNDISMEILRYYPESPFCIIRLPSETAAKQLVSRSILTQSIHEHWAGAPTLSALHKAIQEQTTHLWSNHRTTSFKISIDAFQGSRSNELRLALINSFSYLPFEGPIRMRDPEQEFTLFEQWDFQAVTRQLTTPLRVHFGRFIARGARDLVGKYDLKRRGYISRTSMDAELSLVTANVALAGPGKLMYDPFVGTGSFPLACAQFGALALGSDIDGRSIRGEEIAAGQGALNEQKKKKGGEREKGKNTRGLKGNFEQYGLEHLLGDVFVCDLTNSPVTRQGRRRMFFDGILCDPPYGVREGLRVLGVRDPTREPWVVEKGKILYKNADFVPPKKSYGFHAMLENLLQFATDTLVDHGRLAFWMPSVNDEAQEIPLLTHPAMELVVVCVQPFNRWSRKLITYRRRPDEEVDKEVLKRWESKWADKIIGGAQNGEDANTVDTTDEDGSKVGYSADELNPFRRAYFNGFRPDDAPMETSASKESIPMLTGPNTT